MSELPAYGADCEDAGARSILVWNGLVTRMRRIGGERRRTGLAWTSTVHSSEGERHEHSHDCLPAAALVTGHTGAINGARSGADVTQVSRFAGHSKVSTTLDLYVGEFEKRKVNDSRTRLAAIYGAVEGRRARHDTA